MAKGFHYAGKDYIWKQKELYRMPYNSGFRYYELLKCAEWKDKGFILGSQRKSLKQLKSMTTDVSYNITIDLEEKLPF